MHINEIDYIILVLLGISAIIGILRGLIKEVLLFLNILAASICTYLFKERILSLFDFVASDFIKSTLARSSIFSFVFIAGRIIIFWIYKVIPIQNGFKIIDKLIGCGFGLLRGLLIIVGISVILQNITNVGANSKWKESLLLTQINKFSVLIIPEPFMKYLQEELNKK